MSGEVSHGAKSALVDDEQEKDADQECRPTILVVDDDDDHPAATAADASPPLPLHLLLDAGYGIPRESRPRQEKILAMAKQIANFLEWQQQQMQLSVQLESESPVAVAPVTVIGCNDDDMKAALLQRLESLWANSRTKTTKETHSTQEEQLDADPTPTPKNDNIPTPPRLPSHFSFARDEDHTRVLLQNAVYLSPDAPSSLDPSRPPPTHVIVGLLIDRRVQVNRSLSRSEQLHLPALRWPMEVLSVRDDDDDASDDHQYHHSQEPLNVDTILEALQQWSWNTTAGTTETNTNDDTAFRHASLQAFRNHAQRHPARPQHRPT